MATPNPCLFTYNPYPLIADQLAEGMDAIATAAPETIDDLVNAIYAYVQPLYYPAVDVPIQVQIEIKSAVYSIINAYNNNPQSATLMYGPQQSYFIDLLLGLKTTTTTPINALGRWLLDIEDNIPKSNMTIAAQNSLFLATGQGGAILKYWKEKVDTPGDWADYFDTDSSLNYMNIPHWLVACIEGALIGAQATSRGLIAPTTDIVTVNIVTSLIGGLAIGAGKVIFKWVPRLQPANIVSHSAPTGGCGCGG